MKNMLFLLVILTIKTSGIVCQTSHHSLHICKGTKTEQAGVSGSIEFSDKCDLTVTNFTLVANDTNRYSIPGIISQKSSCRGTPELSINGKRYCKNDAVTDTLVELGGNDIRFFLYSAVQKSFTLNYYKGNHKCLVESIE